MARPNRRHELERAAISLFAKKGSAASSIRDIANAAGMTEASIYRHFPSKEALIVSLFRQGMNALGTEIASILQSAKSAQERIYEAVMFVMAAYEKDSDLMTFLLFDLHAYPEADMYEANTNPTDLVTGFIKEISPGEDAALLGGMVMGMITQPIVLHRYGHLKLTSDTAKTIAEKVQQVLGL